MGSKVTIVLKRIDGSIAYTFTPLIKEDGSFSQNVDSVLDGLYINEYRVEGKDGSFASGSYIIDIKKLCTAPVIKLPVCKVQDASNIICENVKIGDVTTINGTTCTPSVADVSGIVRCVLNDLNYKGPYTNAIMFNSKEGTKVISIENVFNITLGNKVNQLTNTPRTGGETFGTILSILIFLSFCIY